MKKLVVLVMMAFLVPGVAYAKNPCKDDKDRFCKDVKASGGKVSTCLRKHLNEVAPACKDQLSKPKEGKSEKKPGEGAKTETGKTTQPAATEPGKAAEPAPAETKPMETPPAAAPAEPETKQ